MADKTYKMTVALSNGNTIDAGTFIAPQGPQGPVGPQGPSGALGEFAKGDSTTYLEDYVYLIKARGGCAVVSPVGGRATALLYVVNTSSIPAIDFCSVSIRNHTVVGFTITHVTPTNVEFQNITEIDYEYMILSK